MKRFAVIGAICASFFLGAAFSAVAQDDRHEDRREEKEARKDDRREEHQEKRERHEEKREEHRRIADEHFRERFGHEHHFAVRHVTVVEGRPHFGYGGYSFEMAERWPTRWAYADDCYIDYVGGGYYLFNLRHPGVRVAVTVLP
ncbi:MAG TPA: hypothetical protein VN310_05440 [Candidatus Dormibacteraeota bacterium]|jgi:hypothetical protein|nr:hypothetical protein [Candidatus Dormibacteraeota bacterium]